MRAIELGDLLLQMDELEKELFAISTVDDLVDILSVHEAPLMGMRFNLDFEHLVVTVPEMGELKRLEGIVTEAKEILADEDLAPVRSTEAKQYFCDFLAEGNGSATDHGEYVLFILDIIMDYLEEEDQC